MEETINYRGHDIRKRDWTVKGEPYRTIDSNYFELTEEDLNTMLDNLSKKKADLESDGIKFKNLRYNFDVCEDNIDDDYNPYGAECEISLFYDTPETDKEAEYRIKFDKDCIDREIEEENRRNSAEKMVNRYKIEEAIRLLEEQGYEVKQK